MADEKKKNDQPGALFIPAGALIRLGVEFIINNIPAALFIGLGVGFVGFAVTSLAYKK